MNLELTSSEVRVLGCLMEKSVTTPDQCPLTLNSLTSACNQKSSRDPVLSLEPGEVQRTARQLEDKYLLSSNQDRGSRVEKYTQRLCNTPFAELQFSDAEFAVICVLLLRGPQTPGELRTRSGRFHSFADNGDVAEVLQGLVDRTDGPFVARLVRRSGRQDSEYAHLFSGAIESAPEPAPEPVPEPVAETRRVEPAAPSPDEPETDRIAALEARVEALEREMVELREMLLKTMYG